MAAESGDEDLDRILGVGFGTVSIVAGLLGVGIALGGTLGPDGVLVTLVASGLLSIAYLVAGVYDTAYAKPKRGVSNLVAAAGLVLVFISRFAEATQLFLLAGAVVLFAGGAALIACGLGSERVSVGLP